LIFKVSVGILLIALVAYNLLPIVWVISTSFKSRLDILAFPPHFLFTPQLDAYKNMLTFQGDVIRRSLLNSILVAIGSTCLSLFLASLAAFSFSRFQFKGRMILLLLILFTRLLPPITAVIPLFLMINSWGLFDTHLALILIYTALSIPFGTWLMKSFFDGVPRELEEAAMVDGTTPFGAYLRITIPLAAPGMAASAIFLFVLAWNEFMFAFIFTSTAARTVPVMITQTAMGEYKINWADMAAITTVVIVPILIFTLLVQKHLVKGLTAGAIK
jgi:multiple sugar transport system permease protein